MRRAILVGLSVLVLGALLVQVVAAAFPIHVASVPMPRVCARTQYEYGAIRVTNPNSWNVPVLIVWPTSGWEDGEQEATLAPGETRNFSYKTYRRGWDLYSAEVFVYNSSDTNIQTSFLNNYCQGY